MAYVLFILWLQQMGETFRIQKAIITAQDTLIINQQKEIMLLTEPTPETKTTVKAPKSPSVKTAPSSVAVVPQIPTITPSHTITHSIDCSPYAALRDALRPSWSDGESAVREMQIGILNNQYAGCPGLLPYTQYQ